MRKTNNSLSSLSTSFETPVIKQEPSPDHNKCKNPVNDQPPPAHFAPPPLPGMVDFASVAGVTDRAPLVMGASFHSIPKPTPVVPTSDSTSGFLSCKRRDDQDNPDARSSKLPCNHGGAGVGFDTMDDTIKNVASALGRDRRKYKEEIDRQKLLHRDELSKKDVEHAEEIRKVRAACCEEVQKIQADGAEDVRKARSGCSDEAQKVLSYIKQIDELKARHQAETDQQNLSFARELNLHKANAEVLFRKERDNLALSHHADHEGLKFKIVQLQGQLDTVERYRRDDFRNLERQMDEREARHRNHAMTELTKTYDTRVEAIKNQMESEGRSHLAELRTAYERKIASLEAELVALKNDAELRRDIRLLVEAVPGLLDHIYSASSQTGAFKTQLTDMTGVFKSQVAELSGYTRDISNQANQLQGILSVVQSAVVQRSAAPGPAPFMFYPPPHMVPQHMAPPHQPSGGRGRHGAFHVTEPSHTPP